MKAIDIAMRNHVSEDDLKGVCRELGIKFEGPDSEVNDQESFLIEKMIQSIKTKKAQKAEDVKHGKKIKLKRKVHVSKEIKEIQASDSSTQQKVDTDKPQSETAVSESAAAKAAPDTEVKAPSQEKVAPQADRSGANQQRRTDRPDRPRPPRPTEQRPRTGTGDRPPRRNDAGGRPPRPAGDTQRPRTGPGRPGGGPGGTHRPFDQSRPSSPFNKDGAPQRRSSAPAGRGGGDDRPSITEFSDPAKKRKKNTTKDRDKKKYSRDKFSEKNIDIRKKTGGFQKREIVTPSSISITETVTVGDLAKKLNVKASEVIAKLMKLGEMVTINQVIDADTVSILADEYGTEVKVISLYDETVIKHDEPENPDDYVSRSPVVTVMGHVDHGKTKLLDAIRTTKVAESEFGGITQHIGAYMVDIHGKKITFLDTPGHAAFTTMRARGANITDIVVLVVAANDGVMPQTIEAISHAKAANVPIIVAINKIDLEDANVQKVKYDLANHGLTQEEWGGNTLFVEISAKQKINIEGLLEVILLQAEMLELKENPQIAARGVVIESKLDPGRGPLCTVLVQKGTLHVGDYFVVGMYSGRVRALLDDQGKEIQSAGPSTPVEILGISGVPGAGDPFECVETSKTAKQISNKRLEYKRIESAKKVKKVTLESFNDMIKAGAIQELNIIVKADVDGSAQALEEALEKLSTDEVRVNVVHSGAGGINESDVMLAAASNALIIGYHVRPTGRVSDIADKENVTIKFYNIIFEATDDVRAAMEGMLAPEIREIEGGSGEIKQVFKVSKVGTIAGALLLSGKINRKSKIRIIREGIVIKDGALKSLKRFKDDVNEVVAGQEFGFSIENFNDLKEGDVFETYELVEFAKTL